MIFQGEIQRDDRDFDYWFGHSCDRLTSLCMAFNLPTVGTKKEKAARLCFAWELGYEPKMPAEIEKIRCQELEAKLRLINGVSIPDPNTIAEDLWTADSIPGLPVLERQQIQDYYLRDPFVSPSDMNDLNTYTRTVSYNLWENGHVQRLFFMDTTGTPCILIKTSCKSSMKNKSYNIWLAINRTVAYIYSAYCSCMAGLPGYCKHVFAVLFKLEHLTDDSLSDPSCTSGPQQWGIPASTSVPRLSRELEMRRHVLDSHPQRLLNHPEKRRYSALPSPSMPIADRVAFLNELAAVSPNCTAVIVQKAVTYRKASSPIDIVEKWKARPSMKLEDRITECIYELKTYYTPALIKEIEATTRRQSADPFWMAQRNGRITASVAEDISATVVRFEKKKFGSLSDEEREPFADYGSFFSSLDDQKKRELIDWMLPKTRLNRLTGVQYDAAPLAYGRQHERDALDAYLSSHRNNGCPDAMLDHNVGLIICEEHPYLGASPDGILTCESHGRRLVEVKCPWTCRFPTSSVYDCEYMDENLKKLRRNPYFYQQIMQMALTGVDTCDLFVWCPNDFYCETVIFDTDAWNEILGRLRWFYENVVLPKLLQ